MLTYHTCTSYRVIAYYGTVYKAGARVFNDEWGEALRLSNTQIDLLNTHIKILKWFNKLERERQPGFIPLIL